MSLEDDRYMKQRSYGDSLQLAINRVLENSSIMNVLAKKDGYYIILSQKDIKNKSEFIEEKLSIRVYLNGSDCMNIDMLDSYCGYSEKFEINAQKKFEEAKTKICDYILHGKDNRGSWIESKNSAQKYEPHQK